MNQWSRFLPFVRPQMVIMACAGLAVMGVAACNLILIKLAGSLWDLITVQKDLQQLIDSLNRPSNLSHLVIQEYSPGSWPHVTGARVLPD